MSLFKYCMKQSIKYILILLVILVFILIPYATSVSAITNGYSDVFDDLRVDENFRAENYPNMTYDYWKQINKDKDTTNDQKPIEVIQIAESGASGGDELYIYTYQPLNAEIDLVAEAITISVEYSIDGENLKNLKYYELELVSEYGTFNKYVVQDFEVNQEPTRYYNITSIYTNFVDKLDEIVKGEESDGHKTAYGVGQQWCASYVNDELKYIMNTFKLVEVTPIFTGNIAVSNGWVYATVSECDIWFIAFTIDNYIVEHIFNADLVYKKRHYEYLMNIAGMKVEKDGWSDWSEAIPVYLTDDDEQTYKGGGFFAPTFSWKRIYSGKDFIKNVKDKKGSFSDSENEALINQDGVFVFSFAETSKSEVNTQYVRSLDYWDVGDVTILRIKFQDYTGDVYDLGAVCDVVNPDNKSDINVGIDLSAINDWFEKIMMLIGILILIVILGYCTPIFKVILDILIMICKFIIKCIYYGLSAPFKLIGELFKKKK